MQKLVSLIFIFVLFPQTSFAIWGGFEVRDDNIFKNYVVGIGNESQILCTGTLIRQDIVLTAAHCFSDIKYASQIKVGFGINLPREKYIPHTVDTRWKETRTVLKIILHPLTDIALLQLNQPASSAYQPVEMSFEQNYFGFAGSFRTLGYGTLANSKNLGRLRETDIFVDEINRDFIDTDYLKFTATNRGLCHGDSGGPLLQIKRLSDNTIKTILVGVNSRIEYLYQKSNKATQQYCNANDTIYFVNIAKYKDWFKQQLEKN